MRRLLVAALLAFGIGLAPSVQADGPALIIVHGWNPDGIVSPSEQAIYQPAIDYFTSEGYDVHFPYLPETGNEALDSIANAEYIQDYIEAEELSSVVLIGHSLGGMVVESFMREENAEGLVMRYVTLDSSVHNPSGSKFLLCWLGPPDQCNGSDVRDAIGAAPVPSQSLLNVWATQYQQEDFSRINATNLHVDDTHAGMVSNPATLAAILSFLE